MSKLAPDVALFCGECGAALHLADDRNGVEAWDCHEHGARVMLE